MNRGLKMFGDVGSKDVHKETKQLHDWKLPIPVELAKLSCGSRIAPLKYLMFLKMRREGKKKAKVAPTDIVNTAKYIDNREALLQCQ